MSRYNPIFFLIISAILLSHCRSTTPIYEAPLLEEEMLDTLFITETAPSEDDPQYTLPDYQASATRMHDLLHTRLAIGFDWKSQHVNGTAELTLKPYFYPQSSLRLDAKNFDIHEITLNGESLSYSYDNKELVINLDRQYQRDEEYNIRIRYTAKPNEGPSSGSAAIMSDKGLFFINPHGDHKDKPQQLWTQGETENNSRWFPTIDKPNERCTQEIFLTVEDRFKTLSNGILVSSTHNGDGTRTDYWKQDLPHAPYLFMLAVGEYSVVEDKWKTLPLYYYVEPEYEQHAKAIFNHTPEMIHFFSDKLNYPYPWDKYAQVVCRDYVSGAMENTGAVIFGEFVQKTERELMDGNNDDIVAHELFHHWFGDLVTCESWSNLTLNEGFATYSEYLWQEYKYGQDAAEYKRIQDLNMYIMSSAQTGTHDLIDFEYEDKEDMFDAHSYNKGGLIVHMLRNYVGDEAFYASLNYYLEKNQFTDVEAHELRLAFEEVTGEDLNWFFDQWFFDKGHPVLDVNYNIDSDAGTVTITVDQIQDPENNPPIFQLPVNTKLYYQNGEIETIPLFMDQRTQEYVLEIEGGVMPEVAVFDGTHDLLGIIHDNHEPEDYLKLFLLTDEFEDKFNALKALKGNPNSSAIFAKALNDKSNYIRSMAISHVNEKVHSDRLKEIALFDSYPNNRAKALKKLNDFDLAVKVFEKEKSYNVLGNALEVIARKSPSKAQELVIALRKDYHKPLIGKMAKVLAINGDPSYLDFFEENIESVDYQNFFPFISDYEKLAKKASLQDMLRTATVLQSLAMDQSSNYFKKYAATNLIDNLLSAVKSDTDYKSSADYEDAVSYLEDIMHQIVSETQDQRLKSSFSKYNNP